MGSLQEPPPETATEWRLARMNDRSRSHKRARPGSTRERPTTIPQGLIAFTHARARFVGADQTMPRTWIMAVRAAPPPRSVDFQSALEKRLPPGRLSCPLTMAP